MQEAVKAAAAKLGVSEDAMSVTVLEETKGLFGKGNVRIRAEASASAEAAPAEAPAAEPEAAPEPAKPKAIRSRSKKAAPAPEPEPEPIVESAAPAEDEATGEPSGDVVATEEDAEAIAELVKEVLESADLTVDVRATGRSGRYVNIELDGKDVAHLVGKHGEVLNALQYLVNIMVGRKMGNGVRATLEGNNYRKRREEALTNLATKIAEQVAKRGEEAVLDALPAFERRIVHKALAEMKGVTTYSEGEEPNRRVVIAPAE